MANRCAAQAWGGVGGPACFVAAWLAGGALRRGYDPVEQAISRLAESGAPTRVLMTAGFGGLAAGMLVAARPLARHVGRSAGLAIAGTALTTVGVALTPLHGDARNTPHTLFAVAGYGTLAAAPLLAAPCFGRTGRRRSAALSVLAGVASAALLTASGSSSASGLLQRAGLTVGHTWLAVTSGAIATGRLGPASSGAVTPAPRLR